MDLERRQPRTHAGVLRPVRLQHGRVVGEIADDVGTEDVAAPEGVGDVAVAQNVPLWEQEGNSLGGLRHLSIKIINASYS